MSTFNGTNADEIITTQQVSSTVKVTGTPGLPSDADDIIFAGGGNDIVAGGRGADTAFLGAGNDTYIWNPGDGSDVIDGGSGFDTLQFNGSNVGEHISILANGSHSLLTRDVGNITMDLNSIEQINVGALGGADNIDVADLAGTGVKQVHVDLAAPGGSGVGDGQVDNVTVHGTAGNDAVKLTSSATETVVSGLSAETHVVGADSTDVVHAAGGDGDDSFDIAGLHGGGPIVAIDGGAGNDAVNFKGTSGDDNLRLVQVAPDQVAFSQDGGVTFTTLSLTNVEQLNLSGGGGNDTISAQGLQQNGFQLTLNGGSGNDTITGGDGNDIINAGGGNDIVAGGRGADTAFLGSGNDTFVWNPGDGSDLVEGQGGSDTLQFNGSNVGENISIQANGSRVLLTRDVGNITMDLNGIEQINVASLGGADNINVADLSGTDVKQVHVDLSQPAGSGTGDGQVDNVTVNGTSGNDAVKLVSSGAETVVSGLFAQTHVVGADSTDFVHAAGGDGDDTFDISGLTGGGPIIAIDGGTGNDAVNFKGTQSADNISLFQTSPDQIGFSQDGGATAATLSLTNVEQLNLTGTGGDDTISAQGLRQTDFQLTLDGGAGNDTLIGGDGNDVLLGGSGNDTVTGGRGADTAFLGSGNDTFIWNPGDGSDLVEGQGGFDTLQFNGSNVGENISIQANGSRVLLTRDVGNITMDVNGVEQINVSSLGGADNINVADLSGTDVKQVHVDLSQPAGSGVGDGLVDNVTVNGTSGNDAVKVTSSANETVVSGLSAETHVVGAENTDFVHVAGGDGDDTFDISGLTGGGPVIAIDGGAGNDAVNFKGTQSADNLQLFQTAPDQIGFSQDGGVTAATFSLTNVEQLNLTGTGGDDTISAQGLRQTDFQLTLDGGAGNDTLIGGDGNDVLLGGSGNDTVSGGRGADTAFLGSGNDTFVWNPGDGSDLVEGQGGFDTLQFNGSNVGENISIQANGSRVLLTRDVGNITMDLNGIEQINVSSLGGADNINVADLSGTDVKQVHVDLSQPAGSGAGDGLVDNVTVNGTSGNDAVKLVSSGAETVVSGLSAETHVIGAENTDVVHVAGGDGDDTFDITGLTGGGPEIAIDGGTGNDVVNLNDKGGAPIQLIENGDEVQISQDGGLTSTTMVLTGVEQVHITGGSGDDTITTIGTPTGDFQLVLDGGAGNDTLIGGGGNDVLNGGAGNDLVIGGRGADTAFLGSGNDTFVWNPGDGSDVVNGQGGFDTLQFNGSNVSENIGITASGSQVHLTRDVANITMTLDGVEAISLATLGGSDNINVGDMTGTAIKQVSVDLAGTQGGSTGDGQADNVTVNGTAANEVVTLTNAGGGTLVSGLSASTLVSHGDTFDSVTVLAGAGDDVIDATAIIAGGPKLVLNGGDGNDVIIGSSGDDILLGGAGDDVLIGGGGHDIIDGGTGNNVIINFVAASDQIDLRSLGSGHSADWAMAQGHDVDGNVVFDFGNEQITLMHESMSALTTSDFIMS